MATCPNCGVNSRHDPSFVIETVMIAHPLGTFSLAGVQMKVTAHQAMRLTHGACGWSVTGHIDGDHFAADHPAEASYDSSADPDYNPNQHCTVDACTFAGISHTATYCGTSQPRRCGCAFCYPTTAEENQP